MARSESSRKSRKTKEQKEAAVEQQEQVDKQVEKKSTKSKRSSSSRRGKRSIRTKKIEVANMAVDRVMDVDKTIAAYMGEEVPGSVDNNDTAESKAIEKAVDSGNFNSEFLTNVDANDAKEIENKAFKKTGVDARGRMHDCCDDVEIMADLMMTDALNNKAQRSRVLANRIKLLKRLWAFRDTCDCEDDYNNDEFHANMRVLATIQRKLRGLDSKIGSMMLGAEQSSSDSSGNGEAAELKKLKSARQNLRYAMNPGTFVA